MAGRDSLVLPADSRGGPSWWRGWAAGGGLRGVEGCTGGCWNRTGVRGGESIEGREEGAVNAGGSSKKDLTLSMGGWKSLDGEGSERRGWRGTGENAEKGDSLLGIRGRAEDVRRRVW